MDLTINYHELRKEYCVIARAREPEEAEFRHQQIITILAQLLGPYITDNDIKYKAPNFIIHLKSAYAQRNILSQGTFQAAGFHLDVLPWSKEHEEAQLPWTPAQARSERTIEIDPLKMLPLSTSDDAYTGTQNLRSNYTAAFGPACNLTAPDLSYLLIADIKNYYYQKHAMFCVCKTKADEIAAMVEYHTSAIVDSVEPLRQALQILQGANIDPIQNMLKTIILGLQNIVSRSPTISNTIFQDMTLISEGPDSIMYFDSYEKLPPLTEVIYMHPTNNIESYALHVLLPEKYLRRLRTIHAEATRKAYKLESFFTTLKTPDGGYETFRTMGRITRKYMEEPLKSPAAIETAATYHSLKSITNWMGYKIMDINYPALANLMDAIQRLDNQMVLLQCTAYNGKEHSDQLYAYLGELDEEYGQMQNYIGDDTQIKAAMTNFRDAVSKYYHASISLSNDFYVAKTDFFAQHVDMPSQNTQSERWMTMQSEDDAYLPPLEA